MTFSLVSEQAASAGAEAADPARVAGRESRRVRHPAVHGVRGRDRGAQEEDRAGGARVGGEGECATETANSSIWTEQCYGARM